MLYEPNSDFDFTKVILGSPNGLQGGSYFTKLLVNNNPLYLQIPKCELKQGLVVTEKKKYCDLMFNHDNTSVIEWFEKIEQRAQELMFEKKDIWFHEDLEISDIENAFTSPIRSYKSGRFYLVRCMFPKIINSDTISCYNENEEPISVDTLNEKNIEIIPLIEVQGIKFSSKNFQIEIGMKQIMVIKKNAVFKNCMIKNPNANADSGANSVADDADDANSVADDANDANDGGDDANSGADDANSVADDANSVADDADDGGDDADDADDVDDADDGGDDADEEQTENTENEDIFATTDINNVNNEEPKTRKGKTEELEEVNLSIDDVNDSIKLKQPNEVYYTMWRSARQKAKIAKKEAILAYLEAKKIKENYMLDSIDSDSDNDEEEYNQEIN